MRVEGVFKKETEGRLKTSKENQDNSLAGVSVGGFSLFCEGIKLIIGHNNME